jgi:hypothetical protein
VRAPTDTKSAPVAASSGSPIERDTAGDLGAGPAGAAPHGLPDVGRREVVEQHDVGARAEGRVHLVEALRLHFDRQRRRGPHAGHRRLDPPGEPDVVVLDEHAGVEARAVIHAAAARTAYFSSARSSGVVLRVSSTMIRPPPPRRSGG